VRPDWGIELMRVRLVTVLIWLLAVVVYLPGFWRMNHLSTTLRFYRQQEVQLSVQNRKLREEIVALKTNPFLTEKLARRELGLIREGEWVVK
jgi:cell division protein FtsB